MMALFGIVFGLLISIYAKNREQAVQLVPFFILMLFLFSGLFVQLVQMPPEIRSFAVTMPLTIVSESVKTLAMDGVGFEDVFGNLVGIISWNLLFIYLGVRRFKKEAKK